MMREAQGGFTNVAEYREKMTDIVFRGIMPERSAEEQVQDAKDAIGKPPPEEALAAARALHAQAVANSQRAASPQEAAATE